MEILIEFLIQAVVEIVTELGIYTFWFGRSDRKPISAVASAMLYSSVAAVTGYVSVMIFPNHFIQDPVLRQINLVVTPLILGLLMAVRGKFLKKSGKSTLRLDSFYIGFLFALVFAGIRFLLCK